MKSTVAEINDFVQASLSLYAAPIYQDVFPGLSSDEIMCRVDAGTSVDTRYLDGTRSGVMQFAYYGKSKNMERARDALESIEDVLDLPSFTKLSEATRVKIEPTSGTTLVAKNEQGEFVYTSAFRMEYYKE